MSVMQAYGKNKAFFFSTGKWYPKLLLHVRHCKTCMSKSLNIRIIQNCYIGNTVISVLSDSWSTDTPLLVCVWCILITLKIFIFYCMNNAWTLFSLRFSIQKTTSKSHTSRFILIWTEHIAYYWFRNMTAMKTCGAHGYQLRSEGRFWATLLNKLFIRALIFSWVRKMQNYSIWAALFLIPYFNIQYINELCSEFLSSWYRKKPLHECSDLTTVHWK